MRAQARESVQKSEQEFEQQKSKLIEEHENQISELKKMHEESLKTSL